MSCDGHMHTDHEHIVSAPAIKITNKFNAMLLLCTGSSHNLKFVITIYTLTLSYPYLKVEKLFWLCA